MIDAAERDIMEATMTKTRRLCSAAALDIVKTFECGQCFRWNADGAGVYHGVAMGLPATVWQEDGEVLIRAGGEDGLWREYFDLDRDYAAITAGLHGGEYLDRCVKFGRGIRILRQEPWEALGSFIISQCNNIKRIKGIVERLCESFGEPVEFEGERFYTFPSAERIAALELSALEVLRSGYRAPYLLDAARAVADGSLELEELIGCDSERAKKRLLELPGVGEKVANCVVLFGLHHMEAFPIDVWIRRALAEHFPKDFEPAALGDYAGLAQQYIFYYARSGAGINNS